MAVRSSQPFFLAETLKVLRTQATTAVSPPFAGTLQGSSVNRAAYILKHTEVGFSLFKAE